MFFINGGGYVVGEMVVMVVMIVIVERMVMVRW